MILKFFLFLSLLLIGYSSPQELSLKSLPKNFSSPSQPLDPPFIGLGKKWVDSTLNSMTEDQRIGQLFMVAAYSNKDKAHEDEIKHLIKNHHIGGLIFMQGGPVRQAKLTNTYQSQSKVPLLISIDGEWGLSMRLDSTPVYPKQMTLGAIQNDSLIYQMGTDIARQCKRIGIHVNFAPVVDVNNNPSNPVINMRSFGENKLRVAKKGIAYMRGLQDQNILANAKHFPGHGDTDADSHKSLPMINHNRERLDSLELYPFRELIQSGLGSMMVAHLYIPSLDAEKNRPTTLSKNVVTKLLKNEMNFKGLVFTDALNMKGISEYGKPGDVDALALLAGNDVLLFSGNVGHAIVEIKKAIKEGKITQQEIDEKCRRILEVKYWCGLNKKPSIDLKNLHKDLNKESTTLLIRKLTEASLTVVENKNQLLPLKELEKKQIAAVAIDDETNCAFQNTLQLYAKIKTFSVSKERLAEQHDALIQKLKDYNTVIISVHNKRNSMSASIGMNDQIAHFIEMVGKNSKVILDVFANPYCLSKLKSVGPDAIIVSYEDNKHSQELSAQLIFGGIKANGTLPVSAGQFYKSGKGIELSEAIRLKYTIPEELGINNDQLAKIDAIVKSAIDSRATPGCQLLIAKDGKVFFHKAYGYHTYDKQSKVATSDLYDIASITKIAASTLAIMRLTDEGFFELDKPLSDYLPALKLSNKSKITIREVLMHMAGLPAFIPFYNKTINTEQLRKRYYRSSSSDSFPYQVARNLYLRKDYSDTMLAKIIDTPLGEKEYKYSDLGYYFFRAIIQQHTGMPYDEYLENNFYSKMGLSRITYRPLEKFSPNEIIPTSDDKIFRKQLVHGYVHDEGAAMLGGVGGHAGLFSDANSLAVLMQMFLNKGEYGGVRYLKKETIEEFTKCQQCINENRRGLGFDKPEMNYSKTGPTCRCVAAESFGHTGFTGTIAWADPIKNVIYIFLSNRVCPSSENKALIDLGTRVKIQEVIYDAL